MTSFKTNTSNFGKNSSVTILKITSIFFTL